MREHAARYDYAQEWLDAIKLAWSDAEDFDFDGSVHPAAAGPRQAEAVRWRPTIVMNAGASPTGQAFAIRNCDALFSMTPKGKLDEFAAHVAQRETAGAGRWAEIDVYTVAVVTCRQTQREAEDYYRHWVIDNADWAAVDRIMAMRGVHARNVPDDFEERRYHQANGMGGVPIVGDPDAVARELAQLAAAGAKGIALSFVNYLDELPLIRAEVLPRLARMGWRDR